jgi:hypothetical protein
MPFDHKFVVGYEAFSTKKINMKKLTCVLALLTALVACGPSTVIEKSWSNPGTTVDLSVMQKVLVVAFMKDETTRRVVEEACAKRLGAIGVPSYSILDKGDKDEDIKAKMIAGGFNGAVVLRLLAVDKETSYVPGTGMYPTYYGGFYPYYRYGMGSFYQPGYYTQDKVYNVETNVYSLKDEKLLWTAVTNTTNPGKTENMINEIADVLGKKMRAEGFLK